MKRACPAWALAEYRYRKRELRQRQESSLRKEDYPLALADWFEGHAGERLSLDNPQTFNQKILGMKLNASTPEKGRLADKYLVREFVTDTVGDGCLIPLLGVWDDAAKIDFGALPDRFVLKATHGCGWNIIVRDKARLNIPATRKTLRRWLGLNYAYQGGFQLHYRYCEPRIVAEEFLESQADGVSLIDYKVHVFNDGDPIALVCKDRVAGQLPKKAYYDAGWSQLTLREGDSELFDCPRPACLDEMIDKSRRLAEGFPFVRVDWYVVNGKLYFGEMTFTPANGIKRFVPKGWNYEFGRRIKLD